MEECREMLKGHLKKEGAIVNQESSFIDLVYIYIYIYIS